MKSAIRDDNPVMFLESEMLYGRSGEVPDGEYIIPLGVGDIKKRGTDVTLVAWNKMVLLARYCCQELEKMELVLKLSIPEH